MTLDTQYSQHYIRFNATTMSSVAMQEKVLFGGVSNRLRPKARRHRTTEELLAELAALPDDSLTTTHHAGAYLGVSTGVLANWRLERRGPEFVSDGQRFVRYRVGSLRAWVATRMKKTI